MFNYIENTDDETLQAIIMCAKELRTIKQQYTSGRLAAKDLETQQNKMYGVICALKTHCEDIQK